MFKLAWRNLWRNYTRTLITAMAIALTFTLHLTAMSVQDHVFGEMRLTAAKVAGGDVVIQPKGYDDNPSNELLVANASEIVEKLRALDETEIVAPMVILGGLVSTSASSVPVGLQAIDPESEAKLANMGRYLDQGEWLTADAEKSIVLGAALAGELQAVVGDRVIVTFTDKDGEMSRALFYLTGTLKTGSRSTDKSLAMTNIKSAQAAARLGDSVTRIGVVGTLEREQLAAVTQKVVDGLPVESLTWDQVMPELVGFIQMKQNGSGAMLILLFLVVLFAILNTFLMIVMERIREFGLLGALGLSPAKTVTLLTMETGLLAVVAMAMGLALAFGLHLVIDTVGIDMTAMYGDSMDVGGITMTDTIIRSRIDVAKWIGSTVIVFFMVMIAAIYPAIKAWRLQPTDAMRYYE